MKAKENMTKIEVIREVNDKFILAWDILWRDSYNPHLFNSSKWFLSYVNSFNPTDYHIVVLSEGEKIVAILPLIKDKHYAINVLRNSGGKYLDRSSLLTEENDTGVITDIFKEISKYQNLYLAEVDRETSEVFRNKKNILVLPSSVNPYLTLDGESCFRFLSKKNESKILNSFKKYKRFIKIRHIVKPTLRDAETIFEIDKYSSKAQKGKESFSRPEAKILIKTLVKRAANFIVIDILYFNKKPVAYTFGTAFRKIYHGMYTAYRKEYKNIIPGKMLIYMLIQKLKEDGYKIIDFGRGGGGLKSDFTPNKKIQYDIYYSPSPVVRLWWYSLYLLKNFVLNRNRFYQFLCSSKRLLNITRYRILEI